MPPAHPANELPAKTTVVEMNESATSSDAQPFVNLLPDLAVSIVATCLAQLIIGVGRAGWVALENRITAVIAWWQNRR